MSTDNTRIQLPEGFIGMLAGTGAAFLADLPDVLAATEPETAIRLNPAKGMHVPEGADRVPLCADGMYLAGRPKFTFDPALHQGLYYVQDASSMAVSCAVDTALRHMPDTPAPRYLEACAAPGGKTLGALRVLPPQAFVVANELSRQRLGALTENLVKWGAGHSVVTSCDAAEIDGLDEFFDIIGADVPCSGEGMMRKEPEAVAQWSPALVADCAALQRRIVDNLWRMLRPGGYMVYSTCTFNRSENEDVVEHLVRRHGAVTVAIDALEGCPGVAPGITTGEHCYRFIPGRIRGEGQFVALLRKPGEASAAIPRRGVARKGASRPASVPDICRSWLTPGMYVWAEADTVHALPPEHRPAAEAVSAAMRTVSCGLEVASLKGRDAIPSQALAMSTALRPDAFPTAEVDAATALRYLERNAVSLPDGTPRGYVLLTHRCTPLGFVKNLGNRSNNLYPASWRILSTGREPVSVLDQ